MMNHTASLLFLFALALPLHAAEWKGLTIAPENRCSPYESGDYAYPPSLERMIIDRQAGLIYSPYTGEFFKSSTQTDIEHIVAKSEAHDSGLCATGPAVRRHFAADLDNLTLASPGLNRGQKRGKDAGEWTPTHGRCWFANRVIFVKRKYRLTIDQREKQALQTILATCPKDQ